MQFMSSWATDDKRTLLYFSDLTRETFGRYIQAGDGDFEAGGLLLGSVHGNHLTIDQATIPTKWDKRHRYQFERMPLIHEEVALSRWTKTQGIIRYLGEWHTHPEDHPYPSDLDRSEWGRLSAKRLDKRPILAVIVGRQSLYVELVPSSGSGLMLSPIRATTN